jgi:hypothetical protein
LGNACLKPFIGNAEQNLGLGKRQVKNFILAIATSIFGFYVLKQTLKIALAKPTTHTYTRAKDLRRNPWYRIVLRSGWKQQH